jgi:hypothetical protein
VRARARLQGYRTVSDKVWVVGQTSRDGDLIGTLIDPDGDEGPRHSSSSSSRRSRRSRGAGSSSDDDDDDDDEGGGGGEVVPLVAVYELLAGLGPDVDIR